MWYLLGNVMVLTSWDLDQNEFLLSSCPVIRAFLLWHGPMKGAKFPLWDGPAMGFSCSQVCRCEVLYSDVSGLDVHLCCFWAALHRWWLYWWHMSLCHQKKRFHALSEQQGWQSCCSMPLVWSCPSEGPLFLSGKCQTSYQLHWVASQVGIWSCCEGCPLVMVYWYLRD